MSTRKFTLLSLPKLTLFYLPLIVIAYGVSSDTIFKGHVLAFGVGALAWIIAFLALSRASRAVDRSSIPRSWKSSSRYVVATTPSMRSARGSGRSWP